MGRECSGPVKSDKMAMTPRVNQASSSDEVQGMIRSVYRVRRTISNVSFEATFSDIALQHTLHSWPELRRHSPRHVSASSCDTCLDPRHLLNDRLGSITIHHAFPDLLASIAHQWQNFVQCVRFRPLSEPSPVGMSHSTSASSRSGNFEQQTQFSMVMAAASVPTPQTFKDRRRAENLFRDDQQE